ncbi:hypothetical protein D1AOALGA4SA_8830 [Olavius algarvensis Delta 1 endosymbiont]|nr:hypothetical protein D1AOALGA4SA_8830 [Olavius algarvensis Delta 1 endosymbiont]
MKHRIFQKCSGGVYPRLNGDTAVFQKQICHVSLFMTSAKFLAGIKISYLLLKIENPISLPDRRSQITNSSPCEKWVSVIGYWDLKFICILVLVICHLHLCTNSVSYLI